MKLYDLLRDFLSDDNFMKGLMSMIKSMSLTKQIILFLVLCIAFAFAMAFLPGDAIGQDLGLIVGAQYDSYTLGATVGIIRTMTPKISVFAKGVIRDPQYEASARFGLTYPIDDLWNVTLLLGPEVKHVQPNYSELELVTYFLASTGIAFSRHISQRATGWIAFDWTPTGKPIQTTQFGSGLIIWL